MLFLQTIVLEEAKGEMVVVLFLNMIVEEAKTELTLVLFQARQAEQAKRKKQKEKQTEKCHFTSHPDAWTSALPQRVPVSGWLPASAQQEALPPKKATSPPGDLT